MEVYYEPSILKDIVDYFGLGFSRPRLFTATAATLLPRSPPPLRTSVRGFITPVTENPGPIGLSE